MLWKWHRKVVSAPTTDQRVRKGFLEKMLPTWILKDWWKSLASGYWEAGRRLGRVREVRDYMTRVGNYQMFRIMITFEKGWQGTTCGTSMFLQGKSRASLKVIWYNLGYGQRSDWGKGPGCSLSILCPAGTPAHLVMHGRVDEEKDWYLHEYIKERCIRKPMIENEGKKGGREEENKIYMCVSWSVVSNSSWPRRL